MTVVDFRVFRIALLALWAGTLTATAQIVPPPVPSIVPAPPAPAAPPPPAISVPVVPKLDSRPAKARSEPRRSFNDRLIGCIDSADAAQLRPGDRVAYSRACANRVE